MYQDYLSIIKQAFQDMEGANSITAHKRAD